MVNPFFFELLLVVVFPAAGEIKQEQALESEQWVAILQVTHQGGGTQLGDAGKQ